MTVSDATFSLDAVGRLITKIMCGVANGQQTNAKTWANDLSAIADSYPAGKVKVRRRSLAPILRAYLTSSQATLELYSVICQVMVCDLNDEAVKRYQNLKAINDLELPSQDAERSLPFSWLPHGGLCGVVRLLKAHYLLTYGDAKGSLVHSIKGDQGVRGESSRPSESILRQQADKGRCCDERPWE